MVRHVYLSLFYMNSFSSSVLRFPRKLNTADRLLIKRAYSNPDLYPWGNSLMTITGVLVLPMCYHWRPENLWIDTSYSACI